MWLITIIMVLTFIPPLAHASDYETESRLLDLEQRALDLEMQMIFQQQRAIAAEIQAATRERKAEMDGSFPSLPTSHAPGCGRNPVHPA